MKPDIIYRPKRPLYSAKVTSLPASAVSAEKADSKPKEEFRPKRGSYLAKVTKNGKVAGSNPAQDGPKAKVQVPDSSVGRASPPISDGDVVKIASDVTAKASAKSQPKSKVQDMKALRKRLKSILSKSEAKTLDLLFERIDRQQAANRKGQAAWRARQRKAK